VTKLNLSTGKQHIRNSSCGGKLISSVQCAKMSSGKHNSRLRMKVKTQM